MSSGDNLRLFRLQMKSICSAMADELTSRSRFSSPLVKFNIFRQFPSSLHPRYHHKSFFPAITSSSDQTSISRLVSDHQHSQPTRTVSISISPTRSFVCRKETPSEQAYGTASFEKEYQLIMSQTPPLTKIIFMMGFN